MIYKTITLLALGGSAALPAKKEAPSAHQASRATLKRRLHEKDVDLHHIIHCDHFWGGASTEDIGHPVCARNTPAREFTEGLGHAHRKLASTEHHYAHAHEQFSDLDDHKHLYQVDNDWGHAHHDDVVVCRPAHLIAGWADYMDHHGFEALVHIMEQADHAPCASDQHLYIADHNAPELPRCECDSYEHLHTIEDIEQAQHDEAAMCMRVTGVFDKHAIVDEENREDHHATQRCYPMMGPHAKPGAFTDGGEQTFYGCRSDMTPCQHGFNNHMTHINRQHLATHFNLVGRFFACEQKDAGSCTSSGNDYNVKHVTASKDGKTLLTWGTDGGRKKIGVVDISNPAHPKPIRVIKDDDDENGGFMPDGEPRGSFISVGDYALVPWEMDEGSEDYKIVVIDIKKQRKYTLIGSLGGRPEGMALSPDHKYVAVAIGGDVKDTDHGHVAVIDISHPDPASWGATKIFLHKPNKLSGVKTDKDDYGPESISINRDNVAVVTLQKNNAMAFIDLEDRKVVGSLDAGKARLQYIDIDSTISSEELPGVDDKDGVDPHGTNLIYQNSPEVHMKKRHPDGVAWLGSTRYFATADEGNVDDDDDKSGGRGFTIWDAREGELVWTTGNFLEHLLVSIGSYDDERSDNNGMEVGELYYAEYGREKLLFVHVEHGGVSLVFDVSDPTDPVYRQALPTGARPHGGVALPSRGLFVVAADGNDGTKGNYRSSLSIYMHTANHGGAPDYPTIVSDPLTHFHHHEPHLHETDHFHTLWDARPHIPFGALSGLACDGGSGLKNHLLAVEDRQYGRSRILHIDASQHPAVVVDAYPIRDEKGIFKKHLKDKDDDYDDDDAKWLLNDDGTVNLDLEGVAPFKGGIVVVAEGRDEYDSSDNRAKSLNLIFRLTYDGVIEEVIKMGDNQNEEQREDGFQGIAVWGNKLVVTLMNTWIDNDDQQEQMATLAIYDTMATEKKWRFIHHELSKGDDNSNTATGIRDIAYVGNGHVLMLEADDNGAFEAKNKRITTFDLTTAKQYGDIDDSVTDDSDKWDQSTTVLNMMNDIMAKTKGAVPEELKGLAVCPSGDVFVVNDNGGPDGDTNPETHLLRYPGLIHPFH